MIDGSACSAGYWLSLANSAFDKRAGQ